MKGIGGVLAMFAKKEPDRKKHEETEHQLTNTKYNRAQFAEARQFSRLEKDVLAAVLSTEKMYTMQEAQQHIQQFMNGEAQ